MSPLQSSLLLLLGHFYIHSIMVGKVYMMAASVPVYFSLASSSYAFFFAVLVLSELMSHQGEKQQCSEAGAAAAPLCLPSRGDKQISGRQITGASEAESAS